MSDIALGETSPDATSDVREAHGMDIGATRFPVAESFRIPRRSA